jgi:hypothetical protein
LHSDGRGYVMSGMRASLVVLSLSLVSGCGSESGFKESLELVVEEEVAIKLESSDPQESLHKSNGELLSLIAASCELPHRIQQARQLSTNATVSASGTFASATRDLSPSANSNAGSDAVSDKLGILSQRVSMETMTGGKVESVSTRKSAVPLTPITPDMLLDLDVDTARVGDLNSHMALYDYLRSKHKLQSKGGIVYRRVAMSAEGNGSEESVVLVAISDEKLRCEEIIKTSTSQ